MSWPNHALTALVPPAGAPVPQMKGNISLFTSYALLLGILAIMPHLYKGKFPFDTMSCMAL